MLAAMTTRDLRDGLVLRWSTPVDKVKIAEFAAHVFRDGADDPPSETMRDLVTRWLDGETPFMGPSDFVVIEDTTRDGHPVVACACHLREEWTFDDISIPVSRPEIVATDPRYRNRGLIREIFAELHARFTAEGRPVQAITGIPYFYRQFGYEYALELGGRTTLPVERLPELTDGETETCTLRPATPDDVPHIAERYRELFAASFVTCAIPDEFWKYRIRLTAEGSSKPSLHWNLYVIETTAAEPCGFMTLPNHRAGDELETGLLALQPGTNVASIAPSLLRAMKRIGDDVPAKNPDVTLRKLVLKLGRGHPFRSALREAWFPQATNPYAWYVRIPDIPEFLRRIAPVLERRLEASSIAGFEGEFTLTFYRGGIRLKFSDGKLAEVDDHTFGQHDSANAGVPRLTFHQLLLGYRSLNDLEETNPDVWVADDHRALVDALFPKSPSNVYDI